MKENEIHKRPLDEVMLAMDVVDTLRHRDMLVERELHSEDRDQKLIERLREIYASQGMDVPDHVLAEGVAALKEERFTYKPPRRGLSVLLARLYIGRSKWAKRAGVAALLGALIWGSTQIFLVGPPERRLKEQVTELNTEIRGASESLDRLERDAERIEAALPAAPSGIPQSMKKTFEAQHRVVVQALQQARGEIGSARRLVQKPVIDKETYKSVSGSVESTLKRKQDFISKASGEITKANRSLAAITALNTLPQELSVQRDAALSVAKTDTARDRLQKEYNSGMTALRAGDVAGAHASDNTLKELRKHLELEYEIRIVSRPKEYSGVWRVPEKNPKARNYYAIVEAVTEDGKVLTLPITSEEDGKVYSVNKWGLRVDLHLFQRISADKQDDGIIQKRKFGRKRKGHLNPEYLMPSTGAAITDW
jgi:hypothetical protein